MAIQIVRYDVNSDPFWGVHSDGKVTQLTGRYDTTAAFLNQGGREEAAKIDAGSGPLDIKDLRLLSPVTRDGDYICQGMNYASHLLEIGRNPEDARHNVIFHKASSCICGPNDDVIRPAHVKALDYEVELGLIVGKEITGPINVSTENLHDYIAGFVITNDVSARDVQIACEQFNKGKSYRTFGPTGPFLVLPTPEEMKRWGELILTLHVNGEQRQEGPAGDMIHQPVETLRELSEVRDLKPGDMIATGTPAGVALSAPKGIKAKIGALLSPAKRGEIIARQGSSNPDYLKPGDVMTASIRTDDGNLDLGTQQNKIVAG